MALASSTAVPLPHGSWRIHDPHTSPLPRTTVSARMTAARLAMSSPSLAANFWKVDSAMLASLPFLISHASRKGFSRSYCRWAVWGRIQRVL